MVTTSNIKKFEIRRNTYLNLLHFFAKLQHTFGAQRVLDDGVFERRLQSQRGCHVNHNGDIFDDRASVFF